MAMKTVLTIAGADSGAAAGAQADVKTIAAHSAYAVTVLTAVTAQTRSSVTASLPLPAALVTAQFRAVFEDFDVAAVKSGMLGDVPQTMAVAEALQARQPPHYVLDPVLAASDGHALLSDEAVEVMRRELVPLAELVTPNVAEAERLAGREVRSLADASAAAQAILALGCGAVLVKGGHLEAALGTDLLATADGEQVFAAEFVASAAAPGASRGTGCALAAAIACHLAQGRCLVEAVGAAKRYVAGGLRHPALADGIGPMDHLYKLRRHELRRHTLRHPTPP